MNGKTKIDSILNPCTAEMDRRTYGIPFLLNLSTYGHRFIKIMFLGITFDFYKSKWNKFLYSRLNNGSILFTPIGSISWPMKRLHKDT